MFLYLLYLDAVLAAQLSNLIHLVSGLLGPVVIGLLHLSAELAGLLLDHLHLGPGVPVQLSDLLHLVPSSPTFAVVFSLSDLLHLFS